MATPSLEQRAAEPPPQPLDRFELQELSGLDQRAKYDKNLSHEEEMHLINLKERLKRYGSTPKAAC